MKLIEFFGLKVKPRMTKGKHMFCPMETGRIHNNLFCIRDKDGNCFLIKTENGFIAIDSGYKNSLNIRQGLEQLGISPDSVHSVFLTHLDIDHAGGMDIEAGEIFPRAEIYLSIPENGYLTGSIFRKEIGPVHCKMPIKLREDRHLLKDREKIICDGICVEAVYAPGHSAGHTAYRINRDLFAGDCMISDGKEGWCFYDFWNSDTEENRRSLESLQEYCRSGNIENIITSHSGMISPLKAFVHRDISPQWKEKGFSLIPDAPDDLYKDT